MTVAMALAVTVALAVALTMTFIMIMHNALYINSKLFILRLFNKLNLIASPRIMQVVLSPFIYIILVFIESAISGLDPVIFFWGKSEKVYQVVLRV